MFKLLKIFCVILSCLFLSFSISWAEIQIAQRPTALPEGKQASRFGDGFTPGGKIIIHDINPNGQERLYEYFADENGHFETSFVYQSPDFDVTIGQHHFYAIDFDTGNRSQNDMHYEITEGPVPTIGTGPLEGVAGAPFERWGDGFTPYGTAYLYFYGPDGQEYHDKEITLTPEGTFSFTSALEIGMSPGVYSWKAVDNTTGLEDTVSFTIIEGDLEGINAEIVFAMDTSGSMSDEFDVLCERIDEVASGLKAKGINVIPKIFGIYDMQYCTEYTVYQTIVDSGGDPLVNHSEDWGPAITDLANHYPWTPNYYRVVIPMSDEAADNGSPWGADDDQAISEAINAAKNSVIVIPIVCSGYDEKIAIEADSIGFQTGGTYFTSEAPAEDLIQGIIDAITNAVGGIIATDVWPYCYIDDAWENPDETDIYKLKGDIVQLACQINNNTDDYNGNINVTLGFEYPENWRLILDDPQVAIRKRKSMEMDDEAIPAENIASSAGMVEISNIEVPPKSGDVMGRSEDYLVKLAIPKNIEAGTIVANFKVRWNEPLSNKARSRSKELDTINIVSIDRFIVTNRNLMYKKYGCGIGNQCKENENINFILSNLYKLASYQKAYVFYVDWWDAYDDFSGVENDYSSLDIESESYNPIRNWDRNAFYNCSATGDNCNNFNVMSENEINEVANKIDEYTHYWADTSGGKGNNHWMMIVGDDQVVPFYRANDPTPNDEKTTPQEKSVGYDSSDHTEEMARNGCFFTDSLYQDTDNDGWGDGGVDAMHVGRILSNSAENLNSIVENYIYSLLSSDTIFANSATFSAGEPFSNNNLTGQHCSSAGADAYRTQILQAIPLFERSGYDIACQSDGNCGQECMDGNWSPGCLLGAEHAIADNGVCSIMDNWDYSDFYFSSVNVYRDHGSPYKLGIEPYNLRGEDIQENSGASTFHAFAGLSGLADGDNQNIFAYSFLNNKFSTFLGSTVISSRSFNGEFLVNFYEAFTKTFKNRTSLSIGEALNEAKRATDGDEFWDFTNMSYTLYGIPWLKYQIQNSQPDARTSRYNARVSQSTNIELSEPGGEYSYKIQYIIDNSDITKSSSFGFDFVEITEFVQYYKPEHFVLPSKKIKIRVPLDASVLSVGISTSSPDDMGVMNFPLYNDADENSEEPIFISSQGGNSFDPIANPIWREYNNSSSKIVTVDLIPIAYDPTTGTTTLYKNLVVDIRYQTAKNGILVGLATSEESYASADEIIAGIEIQNTSSEAESFNVSAKILNLSGEELNAAQDVVLINSGEIGSIDINLGNIGATGTYFLEATVSDSVNEIGSMSTQFNIVTGHITNFTLPETANSGQTASFPVSFQNDTTAAIDVDFKIHFYQGNNFIGPTAPMQLKVPAESETTANLQWNIPSNFLGQYTAIAIAEIEGVLYDERRETFTIVSQDNCPSDPNKSKPGVCGCGIPDTDSDADGTPDCNDGCPNDPSRITGCGPVAEAGPSQTVTEGSPVSLNGSGSTTGEGITYQWTHTVDPAAGSTVELTDANTIQATFIAPEVGPEGDTLTFKLTVTDSNGYAIHDTCDIIVQDTDPGVIADAGPNQTVFEKTMVSLNGSNSTAGPDITYQWLQTSAPYVNITDENAIQTTFIAPDVESAGATLVFKLTVTDANGNDDADTCAVVVQDTDPPPAAQPALTAEAGLDQTAYEGDVVVLNGIRSNTGAGITYQWTQIDGSPVNISRANSIQASFTAPDVGVNGERLAFKLVVTSADGAAASDTSSVMVYNIAAPSTPASSNDKGNAGDTNNCFINSVFNQI